MRTSTSAGRVSGKVAIVTGSGSGIGRAIAQALASEGAKVVVADINRQGAQDTVRLVEDAGGEAIAITVDVSDEGSVAEMVASTVERFGTVDVLCNNAALTSPTHAAQDLTVTDIDADRWDQTFAVNVRGPALACKHAIPHMVAAGGGSIVNISSLASLAGDLRLVAYGASKGALNTLTSYVATSHGPLGIRCNAIAPGAILPTDQSGAPVIKAGYPEITGSSNLVPWAGSAADIANAVVFLASDESRFVTGEIIRVDGGFLAHMPTYAQKRLTAR